MSTNLEPLIIAVDMDDHGYRSDLKDGVNAHQSRDDLPSSLTPFGSCSAFTWGEVNVKRVTFPGQVVT
jgi:hypothetical protein